MSLRRDINVKMYSHYMYKALAFKSLESKQLMLSDRYCTHNKNRHVRQKIQ